MIKRQLETTLRKPSVQLKLLVITFLFIPSLIEQSGIMETLTGEIRNGGKPTVAIMLLYTFNYLYFYVDVFIVGFILLIPDIIRDEHIEKQSIIMNIARKKAAVAAISRIVCFCAAYVAWFVFLTVVIAGLWFRDFSPEWPRFISIIQRRVSRQTDFYMEFIMLPDNCLDYPVPIAVFLVLLRSTLGFIFLGMLASLSALLTKKIKTGVGIVIFLLVAALFLYYDFDGGFLRYFDGSAPLLNARVTIDLIKWTIVPFFTFRSMTDNFTDWIQYGIFMGLALCLITGAGIWCYYQKGDLGDADQDE